NKGWNNRATERNDAARAARFDGGAHDLGGTGKYGVDSLLRGFVIETDRSNIFNKTLHAIGVHDLLSVGDVLFEGHDDRDRVGENRGRVKRRAKYANEGKAPRLTSRFHARVKCIALNHGIVTVLFGPNDLPNNRWGLQHVVDSGDFVSRAEI